MSLYTDSSVVTSYALSGNAFTDSLLSDSSFFRYIWATQSAGKTSITYSLPFTSMATALFEGDYGDEPGGTTSGFNAAHKAILELALSKWEDVADIRFSEVAETAGGVVGDIRVAFSSEVAPWWGWAKLASSGYSNGHGDIWINPDMAAEPWDAASYNLTALVHEIGHALGLDHPFEGNIIPDGFDNTRYTVMSYTNPETVYWWNETAGKSDYLITGPMVYDIRAIQYLYGPNMEFHAGNDTYGFTSDVPFFKAIWDAGGKDTIDLSDFTKGCIVNLAPGSYSTLGFDDLDLTENLGIAFNCFIENATGGTGGDRISGNSLANVLSGRAGADRLDGLNGADTLDGGAGNDILIGGKGTDRLLGGLGADKLTGHSGRDVMTGGGGADRFIFDDGHFGGTTTLSADRITDFLRSQGDKINLSLVDANTANGSADDDFSFIGTSAFSSAAGQLRYEAISGNTYVDGDTDGDGDADFRLRIDGEIALAGTDFIL